MPSERTSLFTPLQGKLVGAAGGFVAFLVIIGLLVGVIVVLGKILGMFAHVVWPLATAGILALMLRPIVGLFERKLHMSRVTSVLLLYAIVLLALVGALFLLVPKVAEQLVNLINSAPELWTRASIAVQEASPRWVELYDRAMLNETLRSIIEGAIEQARVFALAALPNLKAAGGTVFGLIAFATSLATVPVYLFFFVQTDEDPAASLHDFLPFLKDDKRDDVVFLIREFLSIIVAFFRGQLLIGLIMGVLLAIGFTVAGLEFGVLFGLMAGLLNAVPYLGTIIGLSAVLPTAYLQEDGGLVLMSVCIGIFILVQTIEGYFLTPRIMGQRTGLHPVAILIAIFFWGTALNGVLGMILAIPLTAFLVTVWRLAKRKYIRKVV